MKGIKLQAALARRRDAEQFRMERLVENDRYFDKWNRITMQHEQWTEDQLLKEATNETNRRSVERDEQLERRRDKLRKLLQNEEEDHRKEMDEKSRPKPRRLSTDVLTDIAKNIQRTADEKRRLELESELYRKWRNPTRTESILLESKTDNEMLAKMNWLDRQVAAQVEREREKIESDERQIRLQTETRRREESANQRRQLRDSEVRELNQYQEKHVEDYKRCERDSVSLKTATTQFTCRRETIVAALKTIEQWGRERRERAKIPYNIRRIKMILRQRNESIKIDLRNDIDLLDRLTVGLELDNRIIELKKEFERKFIEECQINNSIGLMYESEARDFLRAQEEKWSDESQHRETILIRLINDQIKLIDRELEANEHKQMELIQLKESHLTAIEQMNDRLKDLINEQTNDERLSKLCSPDFVGVVESDRKIDVSLTVAPKFGRKKIAWT